jgi:lipopolysaccharide transport system ATP-binding protein
MNDVVISAHGLGKQYRVWTKPKPQSISDRVALALHRRRSREEEPLRRAIWALRDVSFDVHRGEVLGIVGPNGAGKSTLLSVLARITDPSEGHAEIRGRVSSLLEVGTGFHPELSGRDNVFLNGAVLGMSRAETAAKFDEIVDFSGVRDFIDMPIKRYSSGMYVRLAFSVAAHLDPEILLLDEVLAVGDRAFQEKCLTRIHEMVEAGRAVIFVSHDVASIGRLCTRGLVLNNGRAVFDGAVEEAIAAYLHSTPLGGDDAEAEREGTGELRIRDVTVSSLDGGHAVSAGGPTMIEVDIRRLRRLDAANLRLQIGIYSTLGGMYVLLSTDYDPARPLDGFDGGGSVRCYVDELPLKPGTYTIAASIERAGGELVDRVADRGFFAIAPADFYDTGIMPGELHPAPVLVRHRWEVSAGDTAARVAVGDKDA